MTMRLRAHWILPVASPPIENGEVVIEGDRIGEVRAVPSDGRPVSDARDLGNAILMPGLVNAHTHLEYTVMRGLIEDVAFIPWLVELMNRKSGLTQDDWIASASIGAMEAVAGGVTTIADCTDSGAALAGAKALGMRGIVYQEVFGIDELHTVEEIAAGLERKVNALRAEAEGTRVAVGISPHAPYTVHPALFRSLVYYAGREALPMCIHLAESQAEIDLIESGAGPFAEMFARRGIDWRIPGMSPVSYLQSLGALTSKTLLVHGVHVAEADVPIARAHGVSWAHCPKSNAKLGNGVAPLELLRACGPTGLGSDSVASNNTMDLFEEMRFAVLAQRGRLRDSQAMSARDAVEMATVGGARALGLEREVGALTPGMLADVIAVNLDALATTPCYDPYSALVYTCGARDVRLTVAHGDVVYDDGVFPSMDAAAARARFSDSVGKMRALDGVS